MTAPLVTSIGFGLGQYNHAGEQFAVTDQEVDSLIALYGETAFSGLKPGARILDVACSVGTFVNRLRDMGYEADGVDAKPPYLNDSQHIRTGVPIEDAKLPANTYEAIFSSRGPFTFTNLHMFSNEDMKRKATERRFRALKNMAHALAPGGMIHLVPVTDIKTLNQLVNGVPELKIVSLDSRTACMRLVKHKNYS